MADDDYFTESDSELRDVMTDLFKRTFNGTEEIWQFVGDYADEHPDEYVSLREYVEY